MRGLYEPIPLKDIFCTTLGAVEQIDGGLLRFYLCITETSDDPDFPAEKVVVARIVAPAAVLKSLGQLQQGAAGAWNAALRLVN